MQSRDSCSQEVLWEQGFYAIRRRRSQAVQETLNSITVTEWRYTWTREGFNTIIGAAWLRKILSFNKSISLSVAKTIVTDFQNPGKLNPRWLWIKSTRKRKYMCSCVWRVSSSSLRQEAFMCCHDCASRGVTSTVFGCFSAKPSASNKHWIPTKVLTLENLKHRYFTSCL
jgi:hypothetical protein